RAEIFQRYFHAGDFAQEAVDLTRGYRPHGAIAVAILKQAPSRKLAQHLGDLGQSRGVEFLTDHLAALAAEAEDDGILLHGHVRLQQGRRAPRAAHPRVALRARADAAARHELADRGKPQAAEGAVPRKTLTHPAP